MSDVQWVVLCLVGIFVGYLSGYTDKERVKHELSFCVKQLEQNLKRKSVEGVISSSAAVATSSK